MLPTVEASHVAVVVQQRKDDVPLEVLLARGLQDPQPGERCLLGGTERFDERPRAVAQLEVRDELCSVQTSRSQVCAGLKVGDEVGSVARGHLVQDEAKVFLRTRRGGNRAGMGDGCSRHPSPIPLPTGAKRSRVSLQVRQGFLETHPAELLHQGNDITTLSAAEAVIQPFLTIHRK